MSIAQRAKKSKFQERREASYGLLVSSAMRAFYELGYSATTVEDITRTTGLTSGAFYFHFKNKADCFWHVIEHRETLRGAWWSIAEGADPASVDLADLLRGVFSSFDASLPGARDWFIVVAGFYDAHRHDVEARQRLSELHARWIAEVRQLLERLEASGYLHIDDPVDAVAANVFAFVEGMLSHGVVYGLEPASTGSGILEGVLCLLAPYLATARASRA